MPSVFSKKTPTKKSPKTIKARREKMRAILPALKLSQFLAFFVAFIAFYSIGRKFARLLPAQPKM